MFSTGLLSRGAQAAAEASGVAGRLLSGRLLAPALRAICD